MSLIMTYPLLNVHTERSINEYVNGPKVENVNQLKEKYIYIFYWISVVTDIIAVALQLFLLNTLIFIR